MNSSTAIILQALAHMVLLVILMLGNTRSIQSTVKAEVQKLTPVISEGRAYFSGICIEPKYIKIKPVEVKK